MRFWQDTRIRPLPYHRGFLYFVTIDNALRKASGGRKSRDDLILAMLHRRQRDKPLGIADWEALLRDNLGEDAVRQLHAMLDGAAPLPASDAFGPCFERISQPMRRYELGFAPAVLTESPPLVRDLIPDSAAAKAGVQTATRSPARWARISCRGGAGWRTNPAVTARRQATDGFVQATWRDRADVAVEAQARCLGLDLFAARHHVGAIAQKFYPGPNAWRNSSHRLMARASNRARCRRQADTIAQLNCRAAFNAKRFFYSEHSLACSIICLRHLPEFC
ncbi:hypothetical protein KFS84_14590 [Xanthomonas translucens pv. graminis]|uniref:hypothetical protein n=1 Tax=Xanthomonas graminis TaxID=3390026 RepID=UPI000A6F2A7A|nr:hypothetical protein [Xanthomonas translucens]UKE53530.1 hypothetical protein KFS84_14590 [Xanthomonas translucens pv. graminis]